ncbi:IS5 family transposase [Plantibacter sp. Mn2098]|uniref:IS5 family transposase n=1 Tax=Plantibacter sp. Mn2098 TaxID=3395266 RepID=UPI003BC2CA65
MVVEGVAWRFRTGSPWRDLPERFGPWNTVFKRFDRWAKDGNWQQVLTAVQARSDELGKLDWVVSIDSTITRVHQHGATLARTTGDRANYTILGEEPPDHAIGRSRGGLTSKIHLVADGRGRPLSMVLTPGNINDTTTSSDYLHAARNNTRPTCPGKRHQSTADRQSGGLDSCCHGWAAAPVAT